MRRPTVTSLDRGVQSSAPVLMANRGELDTMPHRAIFAYTLWKPPSIYTHLEWFECRVSFPPCLVDDGRSPRKDMNALTNHCGSPQPFGHIRVSEER